jgi:DNA-binding NtrC family response regulator
MIKIGLYTEDRTLRQLLSSALGNEFHLLSTSSSSSVDELLTAGNCDLMLLDIECGRDSLAERLECCRRVISSDVTCVVLASDTQRSDAAELVRLGAFGSCRRPPSIRDLKLMLLRAHENCSLKRELGSTRQQRQAAVQCDQMIGSSPQMRHVYELVARVANINASILITGESGTGKELIANALHNLGNRAGHPFVAVCCGAIPETLIEAELFGHEKGAFTGTVGNRVGYLEQAGDGTLFLDEIGELSLSTQVKLLRVIQQREFCRLGSSRVIPLRARLVFATHQNLPDMVAHGTFRQDLYYRINVMTIEAPALQERPEDIPQIAAHFLERYSEMYQKPMVSIDESANALLQAYNWPGNVRELENVIQRAIIVAQGDTLRARDLPGHLQEQNVANIEDFHPVSSFERQLRGYKVQLAITALRENNGSKTLAARSLHISRAYLHRLIRTAETEVLAEHGIVIDPGQQVGSA